MAIRVDDYENIFEQMPKRGKGDEVELTSEDETALDKAWEKSAEKRKKKKSNAFA